MEKKSNEGGKMKKIEVYIRPEKLNQIKDALDAKGIKGMTIYQVKGHGTQKGIKLVGRAGEYCVPWIDKMKLELIVSDKVDIEDIVEAIIINAQTGKPGDGKIFISSISDAIRIRTRERGDIIL